jgi:DNA polymerase I-like protein with 3'-5' exonuclease and polymerase domains
VVYDLERELLPLLIEMRARGIRIDLNEAERLWDYTHALEVEIRNRIKWRFGINLGRPKSAAEMAHACDLLGLKYPWTAGTAKRKPQPSFTKKWMEAQTHPFFGEINHLRHVQTIRSLCLESCMLNHVQSGRVHPELNPLRTVSGRFSCSNPNDQQVSSRTALGRMVRACFLPEDGEEWLSGDVKQQEPRIMVSYAVRLKLPRALEAAAMFTGDTLAPCRCGALDKSGNPKTFGKCCGDWHTIAARMVDADRDETKPISLGVPYGMKAGKLSRDARIPLEVAQAKLDQYHAAMPFVSGLMEACAQQVQTKGYVRTVLGRRRRFELWEPVSRKGVRGQERPTPLPRELAVRRWGEWNIKRAKDYVGMNSVVQGSGADQIKVAMRDCLRAGLGSYLRLQVHDELCASVPNREVAREICERVERAIKFRVPIVCEPKLGRNWKEAK